MTDGIRPHAQNAAGPFYVVDGCCTACGVPESVAPQLFAWDAHDHCFVKRQPVGVSETDAMLRAVRCAELDCIRYRGEDPEILTRFAELGVPNLCDNGPRPALHPVLRSQVTFTLETEEDAPAEHLAFQFRAFFLGVSPDRHRATPVVTTSGAASLSIAWYEDHFHSVTFHLNVPPRGWLAVHQGNLGMSDFLHDWLTERGARDVRWFASTDQTRSERWRATPW